MWNIFKNYIDMPNTTKKVLEWDYLFMGIAKLCSYRSKDPGIYNNDREGVGGVGCCIVNQDHVIMSTGYNGFLPQCEDSEYPWSRPDKYLYSYHAEENAINNNRIDLKDCILYTTLFPCNRCSLLIAKVGIIEIVYIDDRYNNTKEGQASIRILDSCNIMTRRMEDFNVQVVKKEKEM